MRAWQFEGKDANQYEKYMDYVRRVKQQGIPSLGTGAYGRVWQHPVYKNVAVKFFDDDGEYRKFLRFVLQNPRNRYLPQIIPASDGKLWHKKKVSEFGKPKTVYFVFMKRYSRVNEAQISNLFDQWMAAAGIKKTEKFYKRIFNNSYYWTQWARSPMLAQRDPDAHALAQFIDQNSHTLDLHPGNMMWDSGTKTVIFTDPLAG